jgi:hypothetical protein
VRSFSGGILATRDAERTQHLGSQVRTRACASVVVLALVAGVECRLEAQGGPPYFTDDTGTPGNRKWEINLAYAPLILADQSTTRMPDMDVNFGAGERVELNFDIAWLRVAAQPNESEYGLSQSTVGMKWRFYDNDRGLALSVFPQASFNNPTHSAERDIVSQEASLTLPLQWSKQIGPIGINGDVGYSVVRLDSDEWLAGVVVGHEKRIGRTKARNTEFAVEYFAAGDVGGGVTQATFDAGIRYQIRLSTVLLAMAGHSLQQGGSFVGYVGVQMLLPPRAASEP